MTEYELAFTVVFFVLIIFVLFFFYGLELMLRRLDRYRLKYGFDREIERKEMNNPTEHKLDEREKRFKKRVYKD